MCLSVRLHQFVELHLEGLGIAAVRVLDEEHHKERHAGRARINDELPRVTVAEDRPVTAQPRMTATASANAAGRPVPRAVPFAQRGNQIVDFIARIAFLGDVTELDFVIYTGNPNS